MADFPRTKISAIILAGGESSRMGQDKALLSRGNDCLLSQICTVAQGCAAQTYVVAPWVEKYRDLLPLNCHLVEEQLVLNASSNIPLIGFSQGLRRIQTPWVLLLPCDLPHLASSQVKQWSQALATVLPTEIALLPKGIKGWEPLCGFYRKDCMVSLEEYLACGGQSFQSWLAPHLIRELVVSDRRCLFNCNTPEDWEQVQRSQSLPNL